MIDFNRDVMPLRNKFYRLALGLLRNTAEAEDITQETLIRLWTRCNSLSSPQEAEALGLTISYNLARDTLGRAGPNYEPLDNLDESQALDTSANAIDSLYAADRREMLRRMINTLPVKQQTIVQLRDIEGKSYKEIAGIMQLSEEQVKITLFRARQSLKQLYAKIKHNGN